LVVIGLLYHQFHPGVQVMTNTRTAGQNSKGEPIASPANTTAPTESSQPGDSKSDSGGGTTTALLAPSGDFVSNHHPNLSESPAPNTMSSVCNTSPGATCKIIFTKDGDMKTLPVATTDRGGAAYWNWKLQDIGLTVGTWQIQAIASLNGQTKTALDVLDLVVAQ